MMESLSETIKIQSNFRIKLNYIIDLLLPRLCSSCKQKLLPQVDIICNKCLSKITLAKKQIIISEYEKNFSENKFLDDFRAAFLFETDKPIQMLLHSLKYDKKFLVGVFLGKMIANICETDIKTWKADLILPVPLHRLKKSTRGYNQSDFIAKAIAKQLNIPFSNRIIKRKRFTETQTHLNLFQRKENVKEAFSVKDKNKIKDKNVILVDDVVTTGSTVSECARILKNQGAKKVYALFAAIAF